MSAVLRAPEPTAWRGPDADRRGTCLVYLVPGQGGDPRGALLALYRADASARAAIDAVLAQIDPVGAAHGLGPVGAVLLAEDRLALPSGMAQLAGYAASVAVDRVLAAFGIRPGCVVGQSFGEIAALVCAEAFDAAEGAAAVCALTDAFREQEGRGGMVLIRGSTTDTEKLLARAGLPELVIACLDSPEETIVSGPRDAIDALLTLAESADDGGLPPLRRLAVPYASHHPALGEVARRFRRGLEPLPRRPLTCPVLSPVRRRAYTEADDVREGLADCVIKPVHLIETFARLARTHRTQDLMFVQVGVGATLCRCAEATLPGARTVAPLADPDFHRALPRARLPRP